VVGLGKSCSDYVPSPPTKHEAKEPLSRFIEIAGKCQTIIKRGIGGPKGYRTFIYDVRYQYGNRRRIRLLIVLPFARQCIYMASK
jgi:hypothetical protein